MSRDPALKSIDCTACGAGLDILGGGRVTTHICPYCGTELDALDGYAILKRFGDMPRPDSPFAIGQTGQIKGVDWTITGTLGLREDYGGRSWVWTEHQLYSPTHGYGWLTVENGHLTFARRQRRLPSPSWMGVHWVETAENKPVVLLDGERYVYLQTSEARLTFAEGEFTWAPQIGDVTVTVSALSQTHMLDFSETGQEREIYRSEYLDPAETLAAFGLDPGALVPHGSHPLEPFRTTKTLRFVRLAASGFAVVALLLGVVFSGSTGETVLADASVSLRRLPKSVQFEITDSDRLAGLALTGDAQNSWAYVDLELIDPQDETLFEAGRTVEYYVGRDADGRWSEGNNRASLYFRPTVPGVYTLVFGGSETGLWNSPGFQSNTPRGLTISARQGMASGRPLFLTAAVFALIAGLLWGRRVLHNMRRQSHSDWDDD